MYFFNRVLIFFFSGAIGVSLYGNDDLHNGLVGFIHSAKAIDEKINAVKNHVSSFFVRGDDYYYVPR